MGVQPQIVVEATVQPVTMTRYAAYPRLRGFWFRGPAQANPHVTPQLWQVPRSDPVRRQALGI